MNIICFQDEVHLAHCHTHNPGKVIINLQECILCQRKLPSEYLSSGQAGRACILSLANEIEGNDERACRVLQLTSEEKELMKYHSKSCYRRFQRYVEKKRTSSPPDEAKSACKPGTSTSEDNCHVQRRSKRIKLTPTTINVCIICGSAVKTIKQKKVHKLLRVSEKPMAQKLLNAAKLLKDRVYIQTLSMCGTEDVLAAEFEYHTCCCKEYFNTYNAKIEEILRDVEEEHCVSAGDESLKTQFLSLGLDFNSKAYSLSSIRDKLNDIVTVPVSNRTVKHLIITLYGDTVCFTYPHNKRLSQMVFATQNASPQCLVESLRVSPVKQVARKLGQELKSYNFGLQQSFCDPKDLQLSSNILLKNQPVLWKEFCLFLFEEKDISQAKTGVVFQILHYLMTGGKEPTPFHIMVAEAIHSMTRSKELITTLNHHGICASYNTIRRIDVDIAEQIITTANDNRVPIPPVLEAISPLNGAMDNFDRNESTLAGTASSHDTILVLFQNVPLQLQKPLSEGQISTRPVSLSTRTSVKLRSTVSCQQLIRMERMKTRGEVGEDYSAIESPFRSTPKSTASAPDVLYDPTINAAEPPLPKTVCTHSIESIRLDYFVWFINRVLQNETSKTCYIPSFTAMRSSVANVNFHATTKLLTPILPYPATTYDAILTTMINFQDALKQKGDSYGGLWADEGVYRIAKEIQLLKPNDFSNIFLGLGGFHMEKIVLACLGAYLEQSGIFSVLVQTECYGPDTINSVISGSHYARARAAHSIIHEVVMSMMFEEFVAKYPDKSTILQEIFLDFNCNEPSKDAWNSIKERSKAIELAFQAFLTEMSSTSQSFAFWNTYVSELFPIARDLTNSQRCGDWILYVSAVERAISLFFFFGRTNYSRWAPLFLQDCFHLENKFPLLYKSYMDGGFVVNRCNKGSGVPFDQALEQSYNRPAKVSGGVIGVTRKKDAVALWNIIKHKKDEYVHLLKKRDDVVGELWLHHEFNYTTTDKFSKMGQEVKAYILKLCRSFLQHEYLKNTVTGQVVTAVDVKMLLSCMKEGCNGHRKFIEDRMQNKTASIHSTISRTKFNIPKQTSRRASKVDVKDETIKALLYMEYARHRGFTVEEILRHEITSSAFFLVDNEGYLRKPNKSQLGTELLKLCPGIDPKGPETLPRTNVCIIDFMALVRTISLKNRQPPVKTFGDFATCLTAIITCAAHNSDEIHIIFDHYKDESVTNMERIRRGKCKEMLVFDVISPNQNVPCISTNFGPLQSAKLLFKRSMLSG